MQIDLFSYLLYAFFILQNKILPAQRGQGFPQEEVDFVCEKFAKQLTKGVRLQDIKDIVTTNENVSSYLERKYSGLDKASQVARLRDILRVYRKKKELIAKAKDYQKKT